MTYPIDIFAKKEITNPMGQYADWAACKADGKSDAYCGALKARVEQKLSELSKLGMVTEQVDWTTYVRPGEPGAIHGEVLHPLVSDNFIEYHLDEVVSATNTLIGKPIYKVPFDKITMPTEMHHDPAKKTVGKMVLTKWHDNAINYIGYVDDETYKEVQQGKLPVGSIEAEYAVERPCTVGQTCKFKPEFLQFTGYLLLPPAGTLTSHGKVFPPGDLMTRNKIFEQISKDWKCQCPSKMLTEQAPPRYKVDLFGFH